MHLERIRSFVEQLLQKSCSLRELAGVVLFDGCLKLAIETSGLLAINGGRGTTHQKRQQYTLDYPEPCAHGHVCYHRIWCGRTFRKIGDMRPGRRSGGSAFPSMASKSEVQLQGELNLTRIIGRVTRRSDLAEVAAGEVARSANGDYSVAAEVRRIEVRVIEDVEHLRAELQPEALGEQEVLKDREVQSSEARARHGGRYNSTESRKPC